MYIKRWIMIFLAAAMVLFVLVRCRVSPLITQLAVTRVENEASDAITDAVNEQIQSGSVDYSSMILLEKNAAGQLIALRTNMEQANRLRQQVIDLVNQRILDLNVYDLGIPLGNVISPTVLGGWGPKIPVTVSSVNNASATFESQFLEAGINQTLHQIVMQVTIDVEILIVGGTHKATISQPVVIAETIIVGSVPDAFFNGQT